MIRKIVLIAALALVMTLFAGCHTIQGIGRDITTVGEAIEDAVD
jgi:predicted small secreted protein